jgi:glutaredoxin 3
MIDVFVVSKPGCPWCDMVKAMLSMHSISYDERCMDTPEAQARFARAHEVTTFPQVFVNNDRIGGFEDTRAWIGRGGHLT